MVPVTYRNRTATLPLLVVDKPYKSLVGMAWIQPLDINLEDARMRVKASSSHNFVSKVLPDENRTYAQVVATLQPSVVVPKQLTKLSHHRTSAVAPPPRALSLESLLQTYSIVFRAGIGHCTKATATLVLKDPNVQPTFIKARQPPLALRPAIETELDRLVQLGTLEPIDYSNWAAPIVVVPKPNSKIRMCSDFSTGLNEKLDIHRHPLPTPTELFAALNGGEQFSVIDISEAFSQCELDDASKNLCVINTHKGLF
jgi:hypothetical protein